MSSAGSRVNGGGGGNRRNNNNTASSNRRSGNNLQRLIENGEREIRRTHRTRATAPRLDHIQGLINRVRRFQARLRLPRRVPAPRSPHRATGPTASGSNITNSRVHVGMIRGPARESNISNDILRRLRRGAETWNQMTALQRAQFIRNLHGWMHVSRLTRRRRRVNS